ncbi:MAG: asparaginase [Candidatus Delongbacteria bacterium]|jgi:L-asparaginase|nr:asparaginase [Candidatus Delongbacteria bacterium]
MKKILVITTGGTISMKASKSGIIPSLNGREILELIPQIKNIADLTLHEFSNIPSPMMTPQMMFELSKYISKVIDDYDGIVVTHGTDTVEETAYMLFITLQTLKPVILTAAMRSNEESGLDGPRNLLNAIRVASNKKSIDRGVVLAINDEIFSAREVYKSSTNLTNAFEAPHYGILGIIDADDVIYYRRSEFRYKYEVENLEYKVELIKLYSGVGRKFIDCSIAAGTKGIVIEAFGRGNVNPEIKAGILDAIKLGIPVIITSRVPTGRVLGIYAYEGGAKQLEEAGAIMAGDLNGNKARLKLMVLLGKKITVEQINNSFLVEKG